MRNADPYLQQCWDVLPRLLALFDTDTTSPTCGVGDRYRWGWKLIDFGNGTFQGAANGLARLVSTDLLPEWLPEASALRRIEMMFEGADTLRRRDGSLEEAFPYESSFCVTALVAYDLLSAVELLGDRLSDEQRARCIGIVRPMIAFLHDADEHHAFISNHLAMASAALYKWHKLTGEAGEARGRELLTRILDAQSAEGWFPEYGGADPGYQTLCTHYLADLHRRRPDLNLAEPLQKSLRFLWHFAHPDGSFGGLYGCRNTRFFFPGGIEALATEIPEAAALAGFMRRSIAARSTVTLDVMDEPNLVPMFNSYCWAASANRLDSADGRALPAQEKAAMRTVFEEAGVLVDRGPKHYTIVSLHKGGVCCHFPADDDGTLVDAGVVVRKGGRLYSTQALQPENAVEVNGDTVVVRAQFTAMRKQLPTPFQFWVLRLCCLTLMRIRFIREWIKKALVAYLITGGRKLPAWNRRTIRFGEKLSIEDTLEGETDSLERVEVERPFSAIHMAGQGYWQRQDESQ